MMNWKRVTINGQQVKQITLDGKLLYKSSKLPSEYQEVEYIQSSGNQWINTGIPANDDNEITVKWEQETLTPQPMFSANTSETYPMNNAGPSATKPFYITKTNGCYTNITSFSINEEHSMKIKVENITIDGIIYNWESDSGNTGTGDIMIFRTIWNRVINGGSFKLKSFLIRKNNQLLREFVPCYRKNDGEIGLYDIQNNQFYTNAGTGSFTKGGDV